MNDLVDAIEKALGDQNYWAALYLSINIPDICRKFEFEGSGYHYPRWFESFMPRNYWAHESGEVYLSGIGAYAIYSMM